MTKKLIYIAGPYTADTAEGIAANVAAAVAVGLQVRAMGLVPVVPHIAIVPGPGLSWDAAMAECLAILDRCDGVFFIHGWEQSRGARREAIRATCRSLPVFDHLDHLRAWAEAAA